MFYFLTSQKCTGADLERLSSGVNMDGGEILGQREMTELALHLLLALVHQHHPESLGPGQVQLHLQGGEEDFLSGGVEPSMFLDAARLYQVVTKFGKTKQN